MSKLLTLLSLLVCVNSVFGQSSLKLYEQIAFDYFLDSLMEKDYFDIQSIYYNSKINDKPSMLKSPIGFKDYLKLKNTDTSDYPQIRVLQEESLKVDLSKFALNPGNREKWRICTGKLVTNKKEFKTSVAIELFRRFNYRLNSTIVELVVRSSMSKTFYFFEFSGDDLLIDRWYKAEYTF